ncbi:type II toxin-antitoxin system RelE/ParE family toxin [Crocosphaera sp. UHCC 0190]|uniref:type II toxin-antitoxin system RelE/ParE family toxin n=1 Tax=Crocosphaera sp. UHCC 0190 TaxID=3110246 RepID=UPI002B2138F1|nr:type II toxin-antitoxin system RelE/ParE family toxin [Crocosphaera sp. UHCC 0190]MEA5510820.1 type II toxin-antitoxin system RelE/ParE family toxin [Crocosphaera sp. UHCC 0190]
MEVQPKEIQLYLTRKGISPFEEWLNSLNDQKAILKIDHRLRRVRLGNLGDYKSVGDGVFELRIDYGSGYRIYFSQLGTTIILLLCGGDKSTQKKDINQAKNYWKDYAKRHNTNQ